MCKEFYEIVFYSLLTERYNIHHPPPPDNFNPTSIPHRPSPAPPGSQDRQYKQPAPVPVYVNNYGSHDHSTPEFQSSQYQPHPFHQDNGDKKNDNSGE